MNCAIKSGWQKVGKCNSFRENGCRGGRFADEVADTALESEAFRAEGFAYRIGQKLIWMAGTKPLLVGKHPEVRSGLTPKEFRVGKKVVRR